MARLIDADRLVKVVEEIAYYSWNAKAAPSSWMAAFEEFLDYIEDADTVDAVEVVRCKDCEESHFTVLCKAAKQNHDLLHWVCRINGTDVKSNHYCGYGVRRETDGN